MALTYSDVVMAFVGLVAFAGMSPWIFRAVDLLQTEADPLTSVIVGAVPALVIIALILSTGVASRS